MIANTSRTPNRGSQNYRADIDGLRAVAVAIVVVYHAFPHLLPGGFVGVDVFFVISGYLITGIILGAIVEGRFSFAHFYARRLRRIFPALATMLVAILAAGWWLLYADDYKALGYHAAAGAAFVANFAAWQESSYFDVAADLKPLLHLWSLGIEEQFYLLWPLMLVLAARVKRGPLLLTIGVAAASFLVAIYTVRIDRTPAFFAPWTRFWELLAGALLTCVELDRGWIQRLARLSVVPRNLMAVIGAVMIAAGAVLIDATRVFPGLWVLLPVGGTFLLLTAGETAWFNRRVLSLPALVWIGLISYPLYLWHWPLLSIARISTAAPLSVELRLVLVAASVVLAWLTYRVIERPIRFTVRDWRVVPALAGAMGLVCAAGVATHASGGFLERRINRSDAARLVDFYERMRREGLRDAYRAECDFMDWKTEAARDEIDPGCTTPGRNGTVLLWGDSFAQALSKGIREVVPPGVALAQVATSACRPAIDEFDLTVPGRRCEKANRFAMAQVQRLRPQVTIVAQSADHATADLPRLAQHVLALGSSHVFIVGPFPVWSPGLPRIFADHHLDSRPDFVADGINPEIFARDQEVARSVEELANVTYVSLLDRLCRDGACRARVPGEDELDLMVLDFGHLTPKGSQYVGRAVFKPLLDRLQAP